MIGPDLIITEKENKLLVPLHFLYTLPGTYPFHWCYAHPAVLALKVHVTNLVVVAWYDNEQPSQGGAWC